MGQHSNSDKPAKWAYISVGSNLGDPLDNCRRGIETLAAHPAIRLLAASPFYRTAPQDFLDQDWFVNAAVKVETTLTPHELLAATRLVQDQLGRKQPSVRFGPRVLDLDIVLYQDVVMQTPELTIPHPRMHKRRFVLQPVYDIDPSVVHPVLHIEVATLLNQPAMEGQDLEPCSSS